MFYITICVAIIAIVIIFMLCFNQIIILVDKHKELVDDFCDLVKQNASNVENMNDYYDDLMAIIDKVHSLNLTSDDDEYDYQDIKDLLNTIEYINNTYSNEI